VNNNDVALLGRLTRKLRRLNDLDDDDIAAIGNLRLQVERVERFRELVREGHRPDRCCLLLSGFAARFKVAATGARQIVSFHIPGDLLDIQHLLLARADHSIEAITPAKVGWIPKADLLKVAWARPSVGKALWRDCLIDGSIFREWVLNVGRRDATSRVAHMLCEFIVRCEAVEVGRREDFELPMTQQLIADATGLTPVHVNRVLKALDNRGVVERTRNRFSIVDWKQLCAIADFDAAYLHNAA